jgi:hypothetical protein
MQYGGCAGAYDIEFWFPVCVLESTSPINSSADPNNRLTLHNLDSCSPTWWLCALMQASTSSASAASCSGYTNQRQTLYLPAFSVSYASSMYVEVKGLGERITTSLFIAQSWLILIIRYLGWLLLSGGLAIQQTLSMCQVFFALFPAKLWFSDMCRSCLLFLVILLYLTTSKHSIHIAVHAMVLAVYPFGIYLVIQPFWLCTHHSAFEWRS